MTKVKRILFLAVVFAFLPNLGFSYVTNRLGFRQEFFHLKYIPTIAPLEYDFDIVKKEQAPIFPPNYQFIHYKVLQVVKCSSESSFLHIGSITSRRRENLQDVETASYSIYITPLGAPLSNFSSQEKVFQDFFPIALTPDQINSNFIFPSQEVDFDYLYNTILPASLGLPRSRVKVTYIGKQYEVEEVFKIEIQSDSNTSDRVIGLGYLTFDRRLGAWVEQRATILFFNLSRKGHSYLSYSFNLTKPKRLNRK